MSPRGSSAANAASSGTRASGTPYSRRTSSQPKSSRQQFSACGACRMRRVRCDLKDLPLGFVGPTPACSNCKERGIKCVDEFADVKAVKLLRRGRRLQQVEAIYGKVSDRDDSSSSRTCTIPTLHSDFFVSPFWQWFRVQRPILDASDFSARFTAHCKGTQMLTDEGGLIAMLLVTWAASFGLNEKGLPETEGDTKSPLGKKRLQWKAKCETYVRELLELIDAHGVLRRPSLDGVRALLLLLPLLEGVQPLERFVIYEATMSQVQALCVVSASPTPTYEDALIRSRIFWYAYIQEGVQTGMRGGRFYLTNEDLEAFQGTLPSSNHLDIGLPSPPSSRDFVPNMFPYHPQEISHLSPKEAMAYKSYMKLMYTSSVCLDISNICRKMHVVLTGLKAARRAEQQGLIDGNGMRDVWQGLDRSWQELEAIKKSTVDDSRRAEIELFACGWQIFIYDCHNVIREALRLVDSTPDAPGMYDTSASRPSSHSSNSSHSSPFLSPRQLLLGANRRCIVLLPRVIRILRSYTSSNHPGALDLFRWDAGLVRDGCFFAACMAASLNGNYIDGEDEKRDSIDMHMTVEDGFSICASVLASMRWCNSKSEEREDAVSLMWEDRKTRRYQDNQGIQQLSLYDRHTDYPSSTSSNLHLNNLSLSPSPNLGYVPVPAESRRCTVDRPMPRPLDLFLTSQRRVESAPNTACSTDGHGSSGWPSYTPPGTATSVATGSTGTEYSRHGSPIFANQLSFPPATKGPVDEMFYQELDQFTYNPPQLTGPGTMRESPPMVSNYAHHQESPSLQVHHLSSQTYMVPPAFNSSMITPELQACPQFNDNCGSTY
ncbi:hypothetical protein D9613_002920 [Agrocybe pediades]|uniref:Zn(2)-C6 fungal-type domain-containing protein n=1 Tax=Agrocybe pediades TaxID=84607 RepID=A0A8H4QQX9_9AGAR|nr:hypothetical protein D9613_002920 [Agrocybe pediades]